MAPNPFSPSNLSPKDTAPLLDQVDLFRLDASRKLGASRKAHLGQFLTPMPVARLMASMVECSSPVIRILDPGAGVGSLFAVCVAELCSRKSRPSSISVTAYELDEELAEYLPDTLKLCQAACERVGIQFAGEIFQADFIKSAVDILYMYGARTHVYSAV